MIQTVKDLLKAVEREGCEVTITKKHHYRVTVPGGGLYFIASTPSCPRSVKNMVAELRRLGLGLR